MIPQKTSTLSVIFCVAFTGQKLYINVALEDLSGSSYTWEVWHSPKNITKTSFSIYSDSNGKNSQRRYFAIGF